MITRHWHITLVLLFYPKYRAAANKAGFNQGVLRSSLQSQENTVANLIANVSNNSSNNSLIWMGIRRIIWQRQALCSWLAIYSKIKATVVENVITIVKIFSFVITEAERGEFARNIKVLLIFLMVDGCAVYARTITSTVILSNN